MDIPNQEVTFFCRDCAEKLFKDWRGWALKANALPRLPLMVDGVCQDCSSRKHLSSVNVVWQNIGIGLPDHWVLKIDDDSSLYEFSWYRKWGFPYFSSSQCPHCQSDVSVNFVRTLVKSSLNPPEIEDFSLSCQNCGLMGLKGNILDDIEFAPWVDVE